MQALGSVFLLLGGGVRPIGSWLRSSDLMGLRDLFLTPLPLSTRGAPAFSAKRKSPAPGWGGALGLLERVLPESKLYCFLLLGVDFFLGPRNPRG